MKPLTVLLCLALLSLGSALSPKTLIPESCNATEFEAGLLLDKINQDRDDGFVFSMFRVVDVHRQESSGNIFYFTVNVLETECPVISGKRWKDCGDRPAHELVFGQCKAVIYINLPWRTVRLYSYNCTLSAVPSGFMGKLCQDCPQMENDLDRYVSKAEQMVEKYNSDSNNTHYFKLDKMERAYRQHPLVWITPLLRSFGIIMPMVRPFGIIMSTGGCMFLSHGRSYVMEFSIKETNCARLTANASECEFLEDDKAHVGFCKGKLFTFRGESQVEVTCETYDLKHTGHSHQRHHQEHGSGHEHNHGHEHGSATGHKHHPHHENHHPNGQNHTHTEDGNHQHGHGPSNGEPHEQHKSPSDEHTVLKPVPKAPKKPISSIQRVSLHYFSDVLPVPSIPDPLPSAGPSAGHLVHGPFSSEEDPEAQPFPKSTSNSPDCPGEHKKSIDYIYRHLPVPY